MIASWPSQPPYPYPDVSVRVTICEVSLLFLFFTLYSFIYIHGFHPCIHSYPFWSVLLSPWHHFMRASSVYTTNELSVGPPGERGKALTRASKSGERSSP